MFSYTNKRFLGYSSPEEAEEVVRETLNPRNPRAKEDVGDEPITMPGRFVQGDELLAALLQTRAAVGCIQAGRPTQKITSQEAFLLAKRGHFEGRVNHSGRVRYIKDIDPRPKTLWERDYDYWQDRAVLRYAPDLTSIPGKVKNQKQSDLWDKMLQMDPAPKNWRK